MMVLIVIALFLGLAYWRLLSKYTDLWDEIPSSSKQENKGKVSIIVAFRNEEENLPKLLSSLDQQDIEDQAVELILVNDHSTDKSVEAVKNEQLRFDLNLVLNEGNGKKDAIRTAWKYATGDILVHTDADCIHSANWLQTMLGYFEPEVQFVSGPVVFNSRPHFFHRVMELDFSGLIAIGAAHIQWSKPMICNGANLAYRRSVLPAVQLNDTQASGDDVFLMQSIHANYPDGIRFAKNTEAMVFTDGPSSFATFVQQRLRWASKNGKQFTPINQYILLGVWFYNLAILGALFSAHPVGQTIAAYLILMKMIGEDRFYSKFAVFFGYERWARYLVFGQLFHVVYMALIPPISQIVKYQWKGRKLK